MSERTLMPDEVCEVADRMANQRFVRDFNALHGQWARVVRYHVKGLGNRWGYLVHDGHMANSFLGIQARAGEDDARVWARAMARRRAAEAWKSGT